MTDFPRGTGQPAAKRRRLSWGGPGWWGFNRLLPQARLSRVRAKHQNSEVQHVESGEIRAHARTQLRRMASTITMNAVFDRRPPRSGPAG
jgi:hypothetical protein